MLPKLFWPTARKNYSSDRETLLIKILGFRNMQEKLENVIFQFLNGKLDIGGARKWHFFWFLIIGFVKCLFCFIPMKISLPFIWGIVYFWTMDGFFRMLKKTSSELICTSLYILSYFQNYKINCFIKGTNISSLDNSEKCLCNQNSTLQNDLGGRYCSVPGSVWRQGGKHNFLNYVYLQW